MRVDLMWLWWALTVGICAWKMRNAPAIADCPPLRIIGHWPPLVFQRRIAVASCNSPEKIAQTP